MCNNKKIKCVIILLLRIFLLIMIGFWMLTIFGFSAADGEESQSVSDVITKFVVEQIYGGYKSMPQIEQKEIWNQISFVVRKIGHFGEYAILSVLISCYLLTYEKVRNQKKYLLGGMIVCTLYAISDETHQFFVAGRSSKIMDVGIDITGALCGMIFVLIIGFIVKSIAGKIQAQR